MLNRTLLNQNLIKHETGINSNRNPESAKPESAKSSYENLLSHWYLDVYMCNVLAGSGLADSGFFNLQVLV